MTRIWLVFGVLSLVACGRPPEVDAAFGPEPSGRDYPTILPFADVLEADDADFSVAAATDAELQERAKALRARAAELRALP